MSWKTQWMRHKIGEFSSTTSKREHRSSLDGSKDGDAKKPSRCRAGRPLKMTSFRLRKVVVESEFAAIEDDCGAEKGKAGVWERENDESEIEFFKKESKEGEEKMYAGMRNDGGGLEREEIGRQEKVRVRTGIIATLRSESAGNVDVLAITEETRLAGREEEVRERCRRRSRQNCC